MNLNLKRIRFNILFISLMPLSLISLIFVSNSSKFSLFNDWEKSIISPSLYEDWNVTFSEDEYNIGNGVVTDSEGNVYVTGCNGTYDADYHY